MAAQSNEEMTVSPGPSLCEICADYGAIVLCEQCEVSLCGKCKKHHNKLPLTKDHTFKPRSDGATNREGSASYDENANIFCSAHPSNVVTMVCDDCADVYCSSCAHAHNGHKTMNITTDIHNIQQISMASLQNMITGFKDLGQRKKDITAHSTLYEEAINTVKATGVEIVEVANQYIDSLCEEIQAEKKDVESKLSGPLGSVSDRLVKTDEQISKLNVNKISVHRNILLRGIQQSSVAHKLNAEFMKTSDKYKDVPTLDTILPNIGKADDVKELLKSVFSAKFGESLVDVDFSKFVLVGEQQVGSGLCRICDDGLMNYTEFVLFHWTCTNISVHTDSFSKISDTQSNVNVAHLVKISDAQFISAYGHEVSLLDDKFQFMIKKNDMYDRDEFESKTVCSNGVNTFIECCINTKAPYKLHINKVDVTNNDFQSTNIGSFDVNARGDYCDMFCTKRGDTLALAFSKQLHIIDLNTKTKESHDVSQKIKGRVWSVSLDIPGYILLGDNEYVHMYRNTMKYVTCIGVGGIATGIVYTNKTLFISTYRPNGTFVRKYTIKT